MIRMNREKPDYSGRWKREKCECMVGGGLSFVPGNKKLQNRGILRKVRAWQCSSISRVPKFDLGIL